MNNWQFHVVDGALEFYSLNTSIWTSVCFVQIDLIHILSQGIFVEPFILEIGLVSGHKSKTNRNGITNSVLTYDNNVIDGN